MRSNGELSPIGEFLYNNASRGLRKLASLFREGCSSELGFLRKHARILPERCGAVLNEWALIGTFLLNFPAVQFSSSGSTTSCSPLGNNSLSKKPPRRRGSGPPASLNPKAI
jgi:hypothetical protein